MSRLGWPEYIFPGCPRFPSWIFASRVATPTPLLAAVTLHSELFIGMEVGSRVFRMPVTWWAVGWDDKARALRRGPTIGSVHATNSNSGSGIRKSANSSSPTGAHSQTRMCVPNFGRDPPLACPRPCNTKFGIFLSSHQEGNQMLPPRYNCHFGPGASRERLQTND